MLTGRVRPDRIGSRPALEGDMSKKDEQGLRSTRRALRLLDWGHCGLRIQDPYGVPVGVYRVPVLSRKDREETSAKQRGLS